MITREEVQFGDRKIMVLNFALMKAHEVVNTITKLLNTEEIEDEEQYALDIRAMQKHLIERGA